MLALRRCCSSVRYMPIGVPRLSQFAQAARHKWGKCSACGVVSIRLRYQIYILRFSSLARSVAATTRTLLRSYLYFDIAYLRSHRWTCHRNLSNRTLISGIGHRRTCTLGPILARSLTIGRPSKRQLTSFFVKTSSTRRARYGFCSEISTLVIIVSFIDAYLGKQEG